MVIFRGILLKQDHSLRFGIGQNNREIAVMESIREFILGLPGKYSIKSINTNLVKLACYKSAAGRDHEPMVYITVNQTDFLATYRRRQFLYLFLRI